MKIDIDAEVRDLASTYNVVTGSLAQRLLYLKPHARVGSDLPFLPVQHAFPTATKYFSTTLSSRVPFRATITALPWVGGNDGKAFSSLGGRHFINALKESAGRDPLSELQRLELVQQQMSLPDCVIAANFKSYATNDEPLLEILPVSKTAALVLLTPWDNYKLVSARATRILRNPLVHLEQMEKTTSRDIGATVAAAVEGFLSGTRSPWYFRIRLISSVLERTEKSVIDELSAFKAPDWEAVSFDKKGFAQWPVWTPFRIKPHGGQVVALFVAELTKKEEGLFQTTVDDDSNWHWESLSGDLTTSMKARLTTVADVTFDKLPSTLQEDFFVLQLMDYPYDWIINSVFGLFLAKADGAWEIDKDTDLAVFKVGEISHPCPIDRSTSWTPESWSHWYQSLVG